VREVVVVGAGIGGLGAAIALARADCHVTLIEQDPEPAGLSLEGAFDAWDRPGVPQALLPHGFVGLGARLLQRLDVALFDRMLAVGAQLIKADDLISGEPIPEDDELTCLACRRPRFELLMRQAVQSDQSIDFRPGVAATGLVIEDQQGAVPVVRGVRTNAGPVSADLVVDAAGRRSASWDWLEDAGVASAPARSEPCGLIYYSRYFRLRPGQDYPQGRWLFGPAAELP
jgi:2-polyprenyl-6-methoxyphenol hydroxylase-like FAD-dependent oxidoreductase